MQHFFPAGHGSSYFKVNPLLHGVRQGSDFDIFFSSIQCNKDMNNTSTPLASTIAGKEDWDMSPFLAKAGWLGHFHGYSRKLMKERIGAFWRDDVSFYQALPSLATEYLNSITQADISSSVSPIALRKLNN